MTTRPGSSAALLAHPLSRAAAVLAMLMVTAILTLSDRVPFAIGAAEDVLRTQIIERFSIPMPTLEFAGRTLDPGHLIVWFVVAFATVIIVGRVRWSIFTLFVLGFAASGLEVAQRYVTSSRNAHLGDLYSNLLGIAAGAAIAAVITIGVRVVRRSRTP